MIGNVFLSIVCCLFKLTKFLSRRLQDQSWKFLFFNLQFKPSKQPSGRANRSISNFFSCQNPIEFRTPKIGVAMRSKEKNKRERENKSLLKKWGGNPQKESNRKLEKWDVGVRWGGTRGPPHTHTHTKKRNEIRETRWRKRNREYIYIYICIKKKKKRKNREY